LFEHTHAPRELLFFLKLSEQALRLFSSLAIGCEVCERAAGVGNTACAALLWALGEVSALGGRATLRGASEVSLQFVQGPNGGVVLRVRERFEGVVKRHGAEQLETLLNLAKLVGRRHGEMKIVRKIVCRRSALNIRANGGNPQTLCQSWIRKYVHTPARRASALCDAGTERAGGMRGFGGDKKIETGFLF
jgi:hypothetical protein